MATASFTKDFTLDSKKAIDSFTEIISSSVVPPRIKRVVTKEDETRGEETLRRIFSH